MKLNGYNSITAIGYVTNFTIRVSSNGKKRADIGIKDELTNNICFCTLFESDKLKYGNNPVTLNGLKTLFLNADDTPKHVLVKASGKVAENRYTNKSGNESIDTKPILFMINPEKNEDSQSIVFIFRGIVDAIKEIKDGEEYKIRLGIVTYDKDKNPSGIEYNTVIAGGDFKEKLDDKDVEKYSQIEIAGDILNVVPRDKYGTTGDIVKEMRVMRVNSVTSSDDLDGFDSIYPVLKKGGTVINTPVDKDKSNTKDEPNFISDLEDELDF